MMFSWNSAAVEHFAKALFGLKAENQLVITAGPNVSGVSIWTIRIRTPSMSIVSPSMMIVAARADMGTSSASA